MTEKEFRNLSGNIQLRAMPDGEESRVIEGYALLFDKESNEMWGFTEVIRSGALTQETVNKCDVVALFNHDRSRGVLSRSTNGAGSLKLTVDEKGLRYEFEAPRTALGDEMVELLKRGDLRESSFAFTCISDTWEKLTDDSYKRYINEIDAIYDVSIVINPAYSGTDVKCRSFEEMREIEEKQKREREQRELTEYYNNLRDQL